MIRGNISGAYLDSLCWIGLIIVLFKWMDPVAAAIAGGCFGGYLYKVHRTLRKIKQQRLLALAFINQFSDVQVEASYYLQVDIDQLTSDDIKLYLDVAYGTINYFASKIGKQVGELTVEDLGRLETNILANKLTDEYMEKHKDRFEVVKKDDDE